VSEFQTNPCRVEARRRRAHPSCRGTFQTNPCGVEVTTNAPGRWPTLSVSDEPSWGRSKESHRGRPLVLELQTNPRGVEASHTVGRQAPEQRFRRIHMESKQPRAELPRGLSQLFQTHPM